MHMQMHNGPLWRASAVVLGLSAVPANAAPANGSKESPVMVDYLLAKLVEFGWDKIALIVVASIAASFLVSWGVARLIAGGEGTFRNALRYFLLVIVFSIGICALAGGIIFVSGAASGALIGGAFALLGLIVINFAVPMVVFDIGFLRALLLNILIMIGNTAVQVVGGVLLPRPFTEIEGKSPQEVQQIVAEWDMKRRQEELESRMGRLAERSASPAPAPAAESQVERVQRLYRELLQAREKLDVNDQAAVVAFNARVAEYNEAKAKLAPTSTAANPQEKQ